jgi:hypothetical protein
MAEEVQDEWTELWNQRAAGLQRLFGEADDRVYHALVPLQLGGSCDVRRYRKYVAGVTYVTSDLTGIGQPPNSTGSYELMICTRRDSDWAANVISRLGQYTLGNVIEPGETMDIDSAVPEGSTISAFLFAQPELVENVFRVGHETASVLLCVGITSRELQACHKEGSARIIDRLQGASVFPFTDLNRESVC